MGGKSKSSSSTSSNQNTTNVSADNSGVTTADVVLQGQTINYNDEFGPDVSKAFESLVNLAGDAGSGLLNTMQDIIELANKSVDLQGVNSDRALSQVAQRAAEQETPGLATVNSVMPLALVGVVGLIAYILLRGKNAF